MSKIDRVRELRHIPSRQPRESASVDQNSVVGRLNDGPKCDYCGRHPANHDSASGINLCDDCENGRKPVVANDKVCPLCKGDVFAYELESRKWLPCPRCNGTDKRISTSNPGADRTAHGTGDKA